MGDLALAEVLRGFKDDRGFEEARRLLGRLAQVAIGGEALAIESAHNHRRLRARGVTVRGTVDVLIATCCLTHGYRLLHSDRDLDGFTDHLGLRVVNCVG
ncbi:MAG: VapC toxin family PIN domain ribonuclease [Proteobacteria bacterium]|nr:VapC toxin family PIN domain ribonuclease [Pseudomonadota bacterium]